MDDLLFLDIVMGELLEDIERGDTCVHITQKFWKRKFLYIYISPP